MDKVIPIVEIPSEGTRHHQRYLRLSTVESICFIEQAIDPHDPQSVPHLQRLELLTHQGTLPTKYPFHTAIQWAEYFDSSLVPDLAEDRHTKLWTEVLNLLRYGLFRAPSLLTDGDGKYNSYYNGRGIQAWYKRMPATGANANTGQYIGYHIGLNTTQIVNVIDSIGLKLETDELIQLVEEHLERIEGSGEGNLCFAADANLGGEGRLDWHPIERL